LHPKPTLNHLQKTPFDSYGNSLSILPNMDDLPTHSSIEPSPPKNIPSHQPSSLPTSPLSSPPPDLFNFEFTSDHIFHPLNEDDSDTADPDVRRQYTRQQESRQSTAQKLHEVLEVLHKVHWTFPQLIRAWVGAGREAKRRSVEIPQSITYRTQEQRREVLMKTIDTLCEENIYQPKILSPVFLQRITAQLDILIAESSYFGRFNRDEMKLENLDKIDFNKAFEEVQDRAPDWYKLLQSILRNQRSHRQSYTTNSIDETLSRRAFTITSIACHSRAKQQSNYFASLLDIYLSGCGTKRRVVESLSGLGLCHSYKQANRLMESLARTCEVCI
jgi:hypothetical protein